MKRKISLDSNEIADLIEELNDYAESLSGKCQLFVTRLVKEGMNVIKAEYGSGLGDSSKDHNCTYQIDTEGNLVKAQIVVSGEDILFIEFGSGIRWNKSPHPKASEYGYGVGTYPGQTHAYDPNGWYYREDGKLHHSWGTEATMPVYKASLQMIEKIEEIAQEVFNSG